jgi:diadenosine tetraphosphate (Ap4A) HIT family hydrolase
MSLMPNETIVMLHQQTLARGCPFCAIASNCPPFDPTLKRLLPLSLPPTDNNSGHIVLSTPNVIAFLDILPLTRAHILVCPREHREKLSDLSPAENAVVGAWLPIIARAACKISGYEDFNLVQNNGTMTRHLPSHTGRGGARGAHYEN